MKLIATAAALAGLSLAAPHAYAQAPLPAVYAGDGTSAATLSEQQLDQLVAPIALYPDPLLTDILAAATYPAEIVEAQRWLNDPAQSGVQGAALTDAAAAQEWDASVKALVAFPAVLAMMDSQLAWTERLGRAFMAQQADVMNAVQRLRHQAQSAGTLQNGPQDQVVNDGDTIAINPPSEQQIYLPAYDPACVYGPAGSCDAANGDVDWGAAYFLPYGYWQWGLIDWGHRNIRLGADFGRGDAYWHGGGHAGVGEDGVWHHAGLRGFSSAHFANRAAIDGGYHYAPPATQFDQPRGSQGLNHGFAPAFAGEHFAGERLGGQRPAGQPGAHFGRGIEHGAPPPVAIHAAPVMAVHAGGGFGRR